MTADYYSILGVSPAAEDVVIRAAYRALMRHYHPDTNPDPQAQRKAQEITAAFAVLRDPSRRAEYDARRGGPVLWAEEESPMPDRTRPAMRGWALASAALAMALVVAVWARPQPNPPRAHIAPAVRHAPSAKSRPAVELEPESERLARLRGESEVVPPSLDVVTPIDQEMPPEASLPPANVAPLPRAEPGRVATSAPRRTSAPIMHPLTVASSTAATAPKASAAASEASAGCRPGGSVVVSAGCKNPRVATLDRMAAGFFSQSMAHADSARKELLMSSHTRSAAARGACRSDSCLTAAYLRQMREISAIMERRSPPTH